MNNQPKQMIFELILKKTLLIPSQEVIASLDKLSGWETNTLISDDNTFIDCRISRYSSVHKRAEVFIALSDLPGRSIVSFRGC